MNMFAKHQKLRKGAYDVVGEVMLFGMGLIIMVGMIALFHSIENEMLSTLGEDRLAAVNKHVASTAMALHEINCTSCYVDFELPSSIGSKQYTISGSIQKKILVYSSDETLIEENIPVPAEGVVQSPVSHLRIQYESTPGKISLYGVTNY